ncbi:hypothetical protein AU476_23125 [Cupriavidus sp. UYMSc13B]|nr:hypothetical protein AU476_23125 [Cupriavidus sp. UYMSc13B]
MAVPGKASSSGARPYRARVPVLAALHGGDDPELLYRRIRIAFQFAIGSIINAVLNNPGPLRLSSRESTRN